MKSYSERIRRRPTYLKIAVLYLFCPLLVLCGDGFDELRQQADAARVAHDPATAIPLYQRALQLNDQWAEGWGYLGNMLFVAGQFVQAEDALHHLSDLQPGLAEGWGMRGMAAMQSGSYNDAQQFFEKSLSLKFELQPAMRDVVLTNRALLLSRMGNFDAALQIMAAFVHGGPDPALLNALGIAALHRPWLLSDIPATDRDLVLAAGKAEFAQLAKSVDTEQLLATLEQQFPNAAGVHYLVGYAIFQTDSSRAEEEFRRELEIDPENMAAASMLAYSLVVDHGDLGTATTLAKRAAASAPSDPGFQYVLGRVLDAEGDHKGAVAALEIAVKLNSDNVEYHVALAAACAAAGRPQEAVSERRRALALRFGHAG